MRLPATGVQSGWGTLECVARFAFVCWKMFGACGILRSSVLVKFLIANEVRCLSKFGACEILRSSVLVEFLIAIEVRCLSKLGACEILRSSVLGNSFEVWAAIA